MIYLLQLVAQLDVALAHILHLLAKAPGFLEGLGVPRVVVAVPATFRNPRSVSHRSFCGDTSGRFCGDTSG
jgi:hypothetical protein